MYQKIKHTLSAIAIAVALLAVSALIGQPLPQNSLVTDVQTASEQPPAAPATQAEAPRTRVSGLSMPYYAFGSLLPRARSS